MNPRDAVHVAFILTLATRLWAGSASLVQSIKFETTSPPPIFVVPKELKPLEPAFRAGLASFPEATLVNGALMLGGQTLGLTAQEATNLNSLLTATYSRISKDPAFSKLPSALPFCLSSQKQTNGHYFVSTPKEISPTTPVIVFLHGYGGNFHFYVWALRESLPEAIIICPSWKESWYGGSSRYVIESVEDARGRFRFGTTNQWLMGISAGGRAGFALYPQQATQFRGYICLASAPEAVSINRLRRESRILMINGSHDPMAPMDYVRSQVALLKRRVPTARLEELSADHFFILSERERCFQLVREFLQSK